MSKIDLICSWDCWQGERERLSGEFKEFDNYQNVCFKAQVLANARTLDHGCVNGEERVSHTALAPAHNPGATF